LDAKKKGVPFAHLSFSPQIYYQVSGSVPPLLKKLSPPYSSKMAVRSHFLAFFCRPECQNVTVTRVPFSGRTFELTKAVILRPFERATIKSSCSLLPTLKHLANDSDHSSTSLRKSSPFTELCNRASKKYGPNETAFKNPRESLYLLFSTNRLSVDLSSITVHFFTIIYPFGTAYFGLILILADLHRRFC